MVLFILKGGAMVGDEPKVEIGLREIYDKVIETHSAVTNWGPRIEKVEQQSADAHKLAETADRRSRENRRLFIWVGSTLGTIAAAGVVAWMNKHM